MNKAYLLLGSNLEDPWLQLDVARKKINEELGEVIMHSSIYETAAWGNTDQPDFLNQVLVIDTKLCAEDLLQKILVIEESMGRIRTEKNAARLIDIDILYYNDLIIKKENLHIPHAAIPFRRFVLEPLNEICPTFLHPSLKKTNNQLLAECTDKLGVKRY